LFVLSFFERYLANFIQRNLEEKKTKFFSLAQELFTAIPLVQVGFSRVWNFGIFLSRVLHILYFLVAFVRLNIFLSVFARVGFLNKGDGQYIYQGQFRGLFLYFFDELYDFCSNFFEFFSNFSKNFKSNSDLSNFF